MNNESTFPMIEVEDALQLVLERASTMSIGIEHVQFNADLNNRILAQNIAATTNHPPFRASIMDGYAVVDLVPGTYPITSSVTAGHGVTETLVAGNVSYVTTGAPVPNGTQAVVKVEDTAVIANENENGTKDTQFVQIQTSSTEGKWIREIGSDVATNTTVLHEGCRLGPAEIALLASVGPTSIPLRRRPVIGVMSTGDELVDATSTTPGSWKIRDSNRPMLLAAAKTAGAATIDLGIAPDDKKQLRVAIINALQQVDILVTSGGVSMGSHDFVKPLLEQIPDCTLHFGRVRMKPGKPTTFATIDTTKETPKETLKETPKEITKDADQQQTKTTTSMLFALPGNPVSSLVAFQLFVEPTVRRLLGFNLNACHHSRVQVRLESALSIDPVRREYHRASLTWKEDVRGSGGSGAFYASSTGSQRSSRLLSMMSASALLCLPRATGKRRTLPVGTVVPALLLNRNVVPPPASRLPHTYAFEEENKNKKMEKHNNTENEQNEQDEQDEENEPTCPCCRASGRNPQKKQTDKPPPALFGGDVKYGGDFMRIGVLTVSDRASSGQYADRGGPEVLRCVNRQVQSTWSSESRVVPDEQREIEAALRDLCDRRGCGIIITTGGTGPSLRDVTPEATEAVCNRMFPGFGERMRAISLQYVPTAILSRQTAGLRGSTFILNLPGNPGAIEQILPQIMASMSHCVHLAGGPRMVVASPLSQLLHVSKEEEEEAKEIEVQKSSYTIDAANLIWLESRIELSSRFKNKGETKTKSNPMVAAMSMDDVVDSILTYTRNVSDQKNIFTKKRGCGRKKSKKKIELAIDTVSLVYLKRAVQEYELPDLGKCLRIVLDYVMEDDGVESSIFD